MHCAILSGRNNGITWLDGWRMAWSRCWPNIDSHAA